MNKRENMLVLGCTGSRGEQALDVAKKTETEVVAICANRNWQRVAEQAIEHKVKFAAMCDEEASASLMLALDGTDIRVFCGVDGICEMIKESAEIGATFAVNSIIGQAGLLPTLSVLENGMYSVSDMIGRECK